MALLEKPIARRYARAMIDLAQQQNALPAVSLDLDGLAQAMEQNAELRHALLSPSFPPEQKRALLTAILNIGAGPNVHPLTRVLVNLLVDKRRLDYIPLIAQSFRAEADRLQGCVRAQVLSAAALSPAELQRLTDALAHQAKARGLGTSVVVTSQVDPSLLSGVQARLGGLVFDGSLKNHLRRIGAELTEVR